MKKKVLSLVLAFCLIIPAMFCLSACNNSTDEDIIEPIDEVEFEVVEGVNGSYETLSEKDETYYIAKPNKDYYFAYWQMNYGTDFYTTNDFILTESWIRQAFEENLVITPVFTNDETKIVRIDYEIEVENQKNVDVLYSNYSYIGDNEDSYSVSFCYYIKTCEDLMLTSSVVTEHFKILDGNVGGNSLEDNKNRKLPYYFRGPVGGGLFTNDMSKIDHYSVLLEFADISNNYIVTVIECHDWLTDEMYKDVNYADYIICEKNKINTIVADNFYDGRIDGYFYSWKDENLEDIYYENEFKFYANRDETFYAYYKEADVIYEANPDGSEFTLSYPWDDPDVWRARTTYYFSKNPDQTLCLESVWNHTQNAKMIVPVTVNGLMVTSISDYVFDEHANGEIIIPNTITKIGKSIVSGTDFVVMGNSSGFNFDSFAIRDGDVVVSYPKNNELSKTTIQNMVNNFVSQYVEGVNLEVCYLDQTSLGKNTLGSYIEGTTKINILDRDDDLYSLDDLWVIVHEIRHFIQAVAMGHVNGVDIEKLNIDLTDNQIGSWKYLDYTSSSEDYDKYYYNAREIDAREFATEIMGFNFEIR